MNKLSVVVSCYNEELMLPSFYEVTSGVLKDCSWDYELIFVNDGSQDRSMEILRDIASQDVKVRVVNFSRNYGHEAAMIAGMDYSTGDAVVCMDADLQHPPACIPDILKKMEEGYDVISMIRTARADGGIVKKITSGLFYKVLNAFSPIRFEENSSDFFAVSRRVADLLKVEYREHVRYLRGFVQSLGFRKTTLEFEAGKREAGSSHYSIRKLIHFSITTLCGFSDAPLKLGIYAGLLAALAGFILMIYSIINRILFDIPAGYTTIIVALCFLFALTLVVIGIIGEYLAIMLAEVKNRPIYTVMEVLGDAENQ